MAKMFNNLSSFGAMAAVLTCLSLVVGCSDSPKTTIFQFTFKPMLGKAVGQDGTSKQINVIGRNGDGSSLYYATDIVNFISVIDPKNPTSPVHLDITGATNSNTPGQAQIGRDVTVESIIAGPAKKAVAQINSTTTYAGVMVMDAKVVIGLWKAHNAHLNTGVNNIDVSAITVFDQSWIAFVQDPNSTGGFAKFGAPPAQASKGPTGVGGGNLGQIIYQATSYKGNLILTFNDTTNGPTIIRHTPDKNNLANPPIDFSAANKIIAKAADAKMQIAPGISSSNILSLAVVGDHLLVNLKYRGYRENGLAVINLANNEKSNLVYELGIKNINVSEDGKTAMIVTRHNLLFFYNGKLTKIRDATDIKAYTEASANEDRPVVFTNDVTADFNFYYLKGAVNIADTWYIATDVGIFPIEVKPVDVAVKAK